MFSPRTERLSSHPLGGRPKGDEEMDCKTALLTLLDQVDYTTGACDATEMVGAVLPKEVIALARSAAQQVAEADADRCPICGDRLTDMGNCPRD